MLILLACLIFGLFLGLILGLLVGWLKWGGTVTAREMTDEEVETLLEQTKKRRRGRP